MDIRIKMLLLRPFFLVSPCTHAQGKADSYSLLQYTNWLIVLFNCNYLAIAQAIVCLQVYYTEDLSVLICYVILKQK